MKVKLLFAFFFSLSIFAAKAQSLNGHYLPFGVMYAYETVKDEALSPISYSGSLGALSLGYYFQNDNWISALDLNGGGGFQAPDVNRENNPSSTTTGFARGSYQLMRRITTFKDYRFYVGLLSHNMFDFRQHNRYSNSSDNFEALFGFGTSVAVQKPFTLFKKNFALSYTFGFPFGAYYMRPGYIKPYLNLEAGSTGFAFWGDYYILNSKTELTWIFNNGNQLRLFYNWEFTQLDVLNKAQTDLQQIGLSTVFKF